MEVLRVNIRGARMNTMSSRLTGKRIGVALKASFALPLLFSAAGGLAPTVLMAQSRGTFTVTGSMTTARFGHTATLLLDGRVLMAGGRFAGPGGGAGGGSTLASAELYDPSTGIFTTTGSMTTPRNLHTATLLPDGRVLIVGGQSAGNSVLSNAELYDLSSGTFTATGGMINARSGHSAILLANGKVLIVGGYGTASYLADAELYDPATGTFAATGQYVIGGGCDLGAPAILLADGNVLFAQQNGAQIYNSLTGTFNLTGTMGYCLSAAALLTNGKVLFAGGESNEEIDSSVAELYDPATGAFASTGNMAWRRIWHTLTLLPDSTVLAAGGDTATCGVGCMFAGTVASAELYDPSTGAFAATGDMTARRSSHTATLLKDGTVLMAGGSSFGGIGIFFGASASAELYRPAAVQGSPTVRIVDNDTGSLTTLAVGDSFSFQVTGAPPLSLVSVSEAGWSGSVGYTDPNGSFRLTGTVAATVVGTWQQTWTIGGVALQPSPLQFTITPKP